MANNITVIDGNGAPQVVSTSQVSGIHTPHQIVDSGSIAITNLPVTQPVNGTVDVGNFPTVQAINVPVGQAIELLDSGGVNKASISAGGAVKVDASSTVGAVVSTKTALTPAAPAAASVTGSSASAVAANANRKGLILTNTTTSQTISIAFGVAAVLNSGITLATGQSFIMDEFSFTTDQIFAIGSGSANLAIQEFST